MPLINTLNMDVFQLKTYTDKSQLIDTSTQTGPKTQSGLLFKWKDSKPYKSAHFADTV